MVIFKEKKIQERCNQIAHNKNQFDKLIAKYYDNHHSKLFDLSEYFRIKKIVLQPDNLRVTAIKQLRNEGLITSH